MPSILEKLRSENEAFFLYGELPKKLKVSYILIPNKAKIRNYSTLTDRLNQLSKAEFNKVFEYENRVDSKNRKYLLCKVKDEFRDLIYFK